MAWFDKYEADARRHGRLTEPRPLRSAGVRAGWAPVGRTADGGAVFAAPPGTPPWHLPDATAMPQSTAVVIDGRVYTDDRPPRPDPLRRVAAALDELGKLLDRLTGAR